VCRLCQNAANVRYHHSPGGRVKQRGHHEKYLRTPKGRTRRLAQMRRAYIRQHAARLDYASRYYEKNGDKVRENNRVYKARGRARYGSESAAFWARQMANSL
jgi:hypothetical protein